MNSEILSSQILNIIQAAIDESRIDLEETRIFAIGPDRFYSCLNIYEKCDWDEYAFFDEDEFIGIIPLNEWLDELDEIGEKHPGESYESLYGDKKMELREIVNQAMRLSAADSLLQTPEGRIVFMEMGFLGDDKSFVTAFCHRRGTQEVLSLMEHRSSSVFIYSFGVLHEDGLSLFYPEGIDTEGTSFEPGEPGYQEYLFDEIEFAHPFRDGNGITLRRKNDIFSCSFQAGHTNSEYGFPGDEKILRRLDEHFRNHIAKKFIDVDICPDPLEKAEFERWLELYLRSDLENTSAILDNGSEKFGVEAMEAFVNALPNDFTARAKSIASYAHILANHDFYDKALDYAAQVEGSDRVWLYNLLPRTYIKMGLYSEAVAAAEKQLAEAGNEEWKKNNANGILALSLSYAGRLKEALQVSHDLIDRRESHSLGQYSLAHILYKKSDVNAARAALIKAFVSENFQQEDARFDFREMPELWELIRRRAFVLTSRKRNDIEVQECMRTVDFHFADFQPLILGSRWEVSSTFEFSDELPEPFEMSLLDRDRFLANYWDEGFRILGFDDAGKLEVFAHNPDKKIRHCQSDGQFIYAAHNEYALAIYDVNQPEQIIGRTIKLLNRTQERIHVKDKLAGISDHFGLELYDVTDPVNPAFISSVGIGRDVKGFNSLVYDFVWENSLLYMACNEGGLVIADVSDLENPVIISALRVKDVDPDDFDARVIYYFSGTLFLFNENGLLWIVNGTDPKQPQSQGIIQVSRDTQSAWLDEQGRFLIPGGEGGFHVFMKGESGADYEGMIVFTHSQDDFGKSAVLLENGFLTWNGDAFVQVKESKAPVIDHWSEQEKIPALKDKVFSFVKDSIQELANKVKNSTWISIDRSEDESFPRIGILLLEKNFHPASSSVTLQNNIVLTADIQRSRCEIEKGTIAEKPFERKLVLSEEELSIYLGTEESLSGQLREKHDTQVRTAFESLFTDVFREVKESALLENLESGRILLGVRVYSGEARIIDTWFNDSYPYFPYRKKSQEFQVEEMEGLLSEKWSGRRHLQRIVSMASRRDDVLQELYRLGEKGLHYALAGIRKLEDFDSERVKHSFLHAAQNGSTDVEIAVYFQEHSDVPESKGILRKIYRATDDSTIKVVCAVGLGLMESDEMIAYLKQLLQEKNISIVETAIRGITHIERRIAELQKELFAVAKSNSDHWIMPMIVEELMRSGYPEIPDFLAKAAEEDKRYEDIGWGLNPDNEDRQDSAKYVERRWKTKFLSAYLEKQKANNDQKSPVWPEHLDPEKKWQSWSAFMKIAGPALQEKDLYQFFIESLASHNTVAENWKNDREMYRGVIHWCLEKAGDIKSAVILASSLQSSGEGIFSEKELKYAGRVLDYELATRAWDYLKKGDLNRARTIADDLLTIVPNNAEYLYLDAYLIWKSNSAEAALEKVEKSLRLPGIAHNPSPRPGRAKLLNLKGCALDELKKWDEALDVFTKAITDDPENAMYHANLAEIYDKLNKSKEAFRWAGEAKKLGSDAEIVAIILTRGEQN